MAEGGTSSRSVGASSQRTAAKEALLKEGRVAAEQSEMNALQDLSRAQNGLANAPALTPTQAVDFNGAPVFKETGEEVTVEDMGRVFQSPPEEIVLYIFKKDKQPYSVEEIRMWQQSHGINLPAIVAEETDGDLPDRREVESNRAVMLNHRSEPMST